MYNVEKKLYRCRERDSWDKGSKPTNGRKENKLKTILPLNGPFCKNRVEIIALAESVGGIGRSGVTE
jgi:hypothetical protein